MLEGLKDQFPEIKYEIEKLIYSKIQRLKQLEVKIRTIVSLIEYLSKK